MVERTPMVLVVADDELIRQRCSAWLEDGDYDVVATGILDEALATAKRAAVVLVAGGVGRATHDELVRMVGRHGRECAVVSLASSASYDLPYDARLSSPVREAELRQVVERLVTRATYVDRLDALLAAARRATGNHGRLSRLRSETRDLQDGFEPADYEAVFRTIDPS
ncbi:response regulator [Haloarchaeobius amylolyticus]|uniref:response regulator n=1 Tax=Haloarchaeobius amylolyticus TaxID=1198296 RepID=UPI00226F34D2|nr:response regulator [Haloarchaeobius amylolyticus]